MKRPLSTSVAMAAGRTDVGNCSPACRISPSSGSRRPCVRGSGYRAVPRPPTRSASAPALDPAPSPRRAGRAVRNRRGRSTARPGDPRPAGAAEVLTERGPGPRPTVPGQRPAGRFGRDVKRNERQIHQAVHHDVGRFGIVGGIQFMQDVRHVERPGTSAPGARPWPPNRDRSASRWRCW